jgi:hypothetical protein
MKTIIISLLAVAVLNDGLREFEKMAMSAGDS